jgi:type IV pilus assembly protein PilW
MAVNRRTLALFGRQRGLGIIELMIAITLGLLITAAVGTIFLSGSKSYNENERFARMQENGRYALKLLADELAMAGYWGKYYKINDISSVGLALTPGCNMDLVAATPIALANDATAATAALYCIDAAETFRATTDILAIKRVRGEPVATPVANHVYLRTSPASGRLLQYTAAPITDEIDWEYVPRIYYIRKVPDPDNADNQIPTLAMKYLNVLSMNNREDLVEGIEDIQVEFGINTGTGTGIGITPAYYTNEPSGGELTNAVTARIHVLVRSREPETTALNRTYRLGIKTFTPVAPDNLYRRRVFTTTVSLRNPAYQNFMNN